MNIPQHWLIDTGPSIGWYLKEGIWAHESHDAVLRVSVVYLELKDIPEASTELQRCHEQFMVGLAPRLIKWANAQKVLVQRHRTLKAVKLENFPYESKQFEDIFRPWVDKWVLGSKPMLVLVVGASVLEGLCQPLGLTRELLRKANGSPSEKLVAFAGEFDPSLAWAWKLLLSGEHQRTEQEARALSRRAVQAKGFYKVKERTLLIWARYWILVRTFNLTETQADKALGFGKNIADISEGLKSFDMALLGTRFPPGAPASKTHETVGRAMEDISDALNT
jgi:hypothetical protein